MIIRTPATKRAIQVERISLDSWPWHVQSSFIVTLRLAKIVDIRWRIACRIGREPSVLAIKAMELTTGYPIFSAMTECIALCACVTALEIGLKPGEFGAHTSIDLQSL